MLLPFLLPRLKDGQTFRVTGGTRDWQMSVPCTTASEARSIVKRCLELSRYATAEISLQDGSRNTLLKRFSN